MAVLSSYKNKNITSNVNVRNNLICLRGDNRPQMGILNKGTSLKRDYSTHSSANLIIDKTKNAKFIKRGNQRPKLPFGQASSYNNREFSIKIKLV